MIYKNKTFYKLKVFYIWDITFVYYPNNNTIYLIKIIESNLKFI